MSLLDINLHTRNNYKKIIIFTIPLSLFLVVIISNFVSGESQQFAELSRAFLHGQLNFLSPIGTYGQDPIFYHGKIFFGDGPFPAILLMPFMAVFNLFHAYFYQGHLQWLLVLGVLYFVYKLARKLTYSPEDSLILALGFTIGSAFLGVAAVPSSWLFAQVVTVFLLFWSLYEYYYQRRWWLIGIICGLTLLTRVTALPIILFFALELWQITDKTKKQKPIKYIQLFSPVIFGFILLGLYNFLRFHNPFNGGYSHQLQFSDSIESKSLGTFSLIHIPTNFFSAVLSAPLTVARDHTSWTLRFPYVTSNPNGISIFITSAYLLNLFTHKWSSFDKRARNLLVAILASAFMVLSFYGIGKDQYGYRYSLDFLPVLFLLFMIMYKKNHKSLTRGMKLLLLGSIIINFYLAWSFLFPN